MPFFFISIFGKRIGDIETTDTGDGLAETDQFLSVKFVGPPEIMNNLSDRFAGDRVAFIMGQLVIFDDVAVFVFLLVNRKYMLTLIAYKSIHVKH